MTYKFVHDIVLKVEEARVAQGITMKDFHFRVGCSDVAYWEHRSGLYGPRPATLQKMLDILGLEVTVTVQPKPLTPPRQPPWRDHSR